MTREEARKYIDKLTYEEKKKLNDIIDNVSDGLCAFDPNLHNAVMHAENEDLPENTVSNVLMKGYKTGDKIIRAAMVAVAN